MNRCAIYARYSTDLQTDNSIAYQFNAIRKYCENNKLTIIDEFADEAMSGTNINRPNFLRMRNNAVEGKYDAIVIYDITRLSRNVGDWMDFHQSMTDLGIKILSPTQTVGSFYNPNDFLIGGMNALIGEHFVLVTREKSMAGTKNIAEKCQFSGGSPLYGYTVGADKHYEINVFESTIVKKIFEMYAEGKSYESIKKTGEEMGYIGRKGGKLSKSQINSILSNEKYIGTYTYNLRQWKSMSKVFSTPKKHKEEDIVRIKNGMPAIISEDIWNVCQQRRRKDMAHNESNYNYPLKGLIYCGVCGGHYRGESSINSRGYGYRCYRCADKRNKVSDCNNISVRADLLLNIVKEAINKHFLTDDINKMVEIVCKKLKTESNEKLKIKRELKEIDSKLENITNAIENGIFYDGLNDRINILRKKQLELTHLLNDRNSSCLDQQFVKDKLLHYRNIFLNSDNQKDYLIGLRNVVDKITVHQTEIYININSVVLQESCGGWI